MHIVLGLLGTIVTILILMNRLADAGIDLGGLNPFLWHRRRQWKRKMQGQPVFHVEKPMEAGALLMTATAKADGDMSSDEKALLLSLFQDEFHLSKRDAADLLSASVFLLGKGEEVRNELNKVMQPSLANFTQEQAESILLLLGKISRVDPKGNELKEELVERVRKIFDAQFKPKGKW